MNIARVPFVGAVPAPHVARTIRHGAAERQREP